MIFFFVIYVDAKNIQFNWRGSTQIFSYLFYIILTVGTLKIWEREMK